MAFVDSDSTIADIQAAIADNVTYDLPGDVTKARQFVAAVRLMVLRFPSLSTQDRATVTYDTAALKTMADDAVEWLNLQDTTASADGSSFGGVKHPDLSGIRP